MPSVTLPATRFTQNGRVLYAVAVPAGQLIAMTEVDVWEPDVDESDRGYQRRLQASRVRAVADYLTGDGALMPLGGLLNARAEEPGQWGTRLQFAPNPGERGSTQPGMLTVPEDALPLWTVDMQHRLGGFRHAIHEMGRDDLEDFPLLVTIADGLTRMEEIEQFELINTTQKKVATDLARQLLATQYQVGGPGALPESKAWEARGTLVSNWLNEHGGVFRGRIIPPNTTARQMPTGVTKSTTFVSSLRPVLHSPYLRRMPEEQVGRLIDDYWEAVKQIWPDSIAQPKDSVILKGPGVYPLHMLMPEVLEIARDYEGGLTSANMARAMQPWTQLGVDYWDRGNLAGATRFGSSGQGHSRTASELRELLPQPAYNS